MSDDSELDTPCPVCGAATRWDVDCPGWVRDGRVMVCVDCGNASRWTCTTATCGWWYREPPGIRGDVAQMGPRPPWLDAWLAGERMEGAQDD